MARPILVSYDGTPNDDDALVLGRLLAGDGGPLALAYVRHSREFDPRREELAGHDAKRRLGQGAQWLGDESIPQHVVISASTWEGLAKLAAELDASMIVFGSDYRTSPGNVAPGTTAQHLLEGGTVPIAVAPAGIRASPNGVISRIAVAERDPSATTSAQALAGQLGAEVVGDRDAEVQLLVMGSQAGGTPGRISLSGAARNRLSSARSAVLFVPAGTPVTP